MASNSREARRRRILERGSDRLALITGQIDNLPEPDPSPSPSLHTLNQDTQPVPVLSHHDYHSRPIDSINDSSHGEDRKSNPVLPKDNHSTDFSVPTKDDFDGSSLMPMLSKLQTKFEPRRSQNSASEDSLSNSSLVSSRDPSASVSDLATETKVESQTQKKYRFFTPNQITSALAATELTRLFCSIALALFVVLSYFGFPILGSKFIKSIIISFRPLYLVLLTNATVVLAQLLQIQGTRRENNTPSADVNDLATQLGNTLEIGLMIKKGADTVFMTCAVYAVIVVCGVSFAQKFE
ncbi:hypothetical protein CsatB_001736 [Cannabis sativa]|uniref:Uncharacterized protein n=2 Tax=Cannabis sativa TaxID=3483 RepID=A0AB40ED15_CANSA|nr:uncharacterized protein LOC115697410 [Cannabis sativa]KAF4379369.1 hypothetical protein F8388_013587 [Cannabis sativa]KAF4398456.1 hypothetical protein G4B88_025435 [Cannabis sativa]